MKVSYLIENYAVAATTILVMPVNGICLAF